MDNIKSLYLSFEGRIGRKSFWLGILGIVVVAIILSIILSPMFGVTAFGAMDMMTSESGLSVEEMSESMLAFSSKTGWLNLLVYLILLVPASALFIKRRHDRGSAGMEYWVYAGLALLMMLLQATGLGYTIVEVGGFSVAAPTTLTTILMLATGVLALYLLVVCGFLSGDDGQNAYGPHPEA
ncbi:MAG TPA: DUF805 domain-containing protein [Devosia sp.]|nr:DUF805 domain-containing protein [Devosia sp.]